MRRYETILIADPDLADDSRGQVLERVTELIGTMGGTLIAIDEWGVKKLAYPIKKRPKGYYVRFDFCGEGPLVDEIERFFRIDDRALKFMTVLLEEEADPAAILAELEKGDEEKPAETGEKDKAASPAASGKPEAAEPAPETKPEAETAAETGADA